MRVSFYGNSEINVLYFNDVHSKSRNVRSFKTAVDIFDKENQDNLNLKLAGGDINMDKSLKPNMLILKLMDLIGLDASSIGNHDMEGGDYWAQAIENIKPKFKFLSSNLSFTKDNPIEKNVAKSMIINRKGENIGIVGASSFEAMDLMLRAPFNNYIDVLNFDKTLIAVKNEVKKLEKQGINKIFLLAHTGKTSKEGIDFYEKLAKIGGIDVIVGGHDHKEFDLWYLSNRNEPVKVLSAGKAHDKDILGEDLDSFGIFKAVFDDNGILIPDECQNEVKITHDYSESAIVTDLEEEYLNSSKVVSSTDVDLVCKNRTTEENPVADIAADSALWIVNKETKGKKAQLAIVNAGTIRGDFHKGDITVGMISQALPLTVNTLIKADLTKKELIDALEWSAKSTTFDKIAPGVMQVSGLKYTIDKDKRVKDVCLVNEDGSLGEKLDNESDDKKYTVVYDVFLMTGPAGLKSLKKDPDDKNIEYYSYSRQDALIEYLSKNFNDKPVTFYENRIKIEK